MAEWRRQILECMITSTRWAPDREYDCACCDGSGITIYHFSYSYIHTPIAPLVAPVDSLFVADLNPHPTSYSVTRLIVL